MAGSEDPARWLDEARRRHRSGDAEGALAGYRRCLEAAPDQPDIRMLAAMAAAQSGRLEEAVDHARAAVAARDDAASRMTLGRTLVQAGEPEEALSSLHRAAGEPAMAADARFHLGQALRALGRYPEAAEALESAVALRPDHGPAWNELGVTRMALGSPGPAREAFRRSLQARPGDPAVLSNLATACLRLGDPEAAEAAVAAALKADPASARATAALARLERHRGRLPESLVAWERSVALDDGSADAWSGLASARQAAGDLTGAEVAYRRSLDLERGNPDALAGMAEWHEWQGRYDEGLRLLDSVAGAAPPGVALVAGRLLRRLGRCEEARSRLEGLLPTVAGDVVLRRQFAFSLGDVCDELDDVAAAWRWYEEGNRLSPAAFDPAGHRALLQRFAAMAPAPQQGDSGQGIVFIVGMPRAGTTLVEQILAAHPDVHGAGELPILGRLMQAFGSPGTGGDRDAATLVRDRYLDSVSGLRGGAAFLTDKMPLNYQYVDMIGAILPGARIVHCRRDPRDIALSCFFTDFIDPVLGFATRLDWLAEYITAYLDFMGLPRPVLSGRILEQDYESLVRDAEGQTRRLLDFLGLTWNPSCLDFHALDRVAATASHAQVRRKIYRTSVGRWKAYEKYLTPLLERLSD